MNADEPAKKTDTRVGVGDDQVKLVGKKPYFPPRLTIYGSIEKLTRSGTGGSADGGMPMLAGCL